MCDGLRNGVRSGRGECVTGNGLLNDSSRRSSAPSDSAIAAKPCQTFGTGKNGSAACAAGLPSCFDLSRLESLDLSRTAVGDDGLSHLEPLKRLTQLRLYGTGVTNEGVATLKPALPGLKVWTSDLSEQDHVGDRRLSASALLRIPIWLRRNPPRSPRERGEGFELHQCTRD
jgi:hypothetical protein